MEQNNRSVKEEDKQPQYTENRTTVSTGNKPSSDEIQLFDQEEDFDQENQISKQTQFNVLNAEQISEKESNQEQENHNDDISSGRQYININEKQSNKYSSQYEEVHQSHFESGERQQILIQCNSDEQKITKPQIIANIKKQQTGETENTKTEANKDMHKQSQLLFVPENVSEIIKQMINDSNMVDTLNMPITKQYVLQNDNNNQDQLTKNTNQQQKINQQPQIKISEVFSSYEDSQVKQISSPISKQTVIIQAKAEKQKNKIIGGKSQQNNQQKNQELVGFKVVIVLVSIVLGYRLFSWLTTTNLFGSMANFKSNLQTMTLLLLGLLLLLIIGFDRIMRRKAQTQILNSDTNKVNDF